jgi:hypothetical protein
MWWNSSVMVVFLMLLSYCLSVTYDITCVRCVVTVHARTQRKHLHHIVAWRVCWNVFTESLPNNTLSKSVSVLINCGTDFKYGPRNCTLRLFLLNFEWKQHFFPRLYFFVFFHYLWTVVWEYVVSLVNISLSSCKFFKLRNKWLGRSHV